MFEQIGAALAAAPKGRVRAPVRRQSRARGHCEAVFWCRTDRQQVQRILLAAKLYERNERQPGERSGPLGSVAIEILELFANLVNFKTGRLEPSIDTIMLKLRRSRDAIVRGLNNLRTHGFLDWLRRYEPTGNKGRGPQVQQTSNAYRLSLPERAKRFLGRLGMAPPLPDDHAQALAERVASIEEHRASLKLYERALFDVGDNPLGQALARLGKSIKQRESARQTESPSSSIINRRE
ncbi:helix-turn-helix domain-containing protein [Sinorhizobium meliloti]|uniref:helix-turn-helix domain-containing protein n=1 Tax=Rhizobium meliloti TaxID=382 RepID=UPI000FD9172F|nr:helix-turn-helix domain-containing protein [Sinorhizobium meliloti]RVG78010.1 helix-turn-helix domain-containing protein [Sinorhizobium meliloti]RVI32123.1 helix-turn-helix domain-containing protein [Sinorhizobium meliloti]RVI43961.1 helix-turn-helix domain-containing protein [Sinorhizobium meliloti]RVJ18816.1 helix-turn-helix domain-containing protein [Sinorhizobium meliloti]RVJ92652.1 helix-turn-helix domain-containing protein [Sinorhizobium meliloti]